MITHDNAHKIAIRIFFAGRLDIKQMTDIIYEQVNNLIGGSNAGEDSNIKCGAKKSGMGTDQRTNPSPDQNLFYCHGNDLELAVRSSVIP